MIFICARNLSLFSTVRAMQSNNKLGSVAAFQTEIPYLVLRSILLLDGFVDVGGARTNGAAGAVFMMNS